MQDTYLAQIAAYYNRTLPSNREIVVFSETPDYLVALGAKRIPIVMKQSTLNKCIRLPRGSRSAHNLPRDMIENIPNDIKNPIVVVNDKGRNTLAIISRNTDSRNNNLLIALQLGNRMYGNEINEIKSIYGKQHLLEYLTKQNPEDVHIYDKKIAKTLSPSMGFQLSPPPTGIGYNANLPHPQRNVKRSLADRLHEKQEQLTQRDHGGWKQEVQKERKEER